MNDGHEIFELIDQDREAAWRRLVDDYSGLVLAVIARYNPNQDARMDAYLYVLEQLAADDMRRIRRYGQGSVERPCQFSTWLKLVVRNLYFDWFRHRHGRKSVPKEIQKLDERAQRIFKLVYWESYTPREAFEILRTSDSAVNYEAFLEALSEIDTRLTGINRAKIHRDFLRAVGPMSLDLDMEAGPPVEAQAAVESIKPDQETAAAEEREALWRLLEELEPEERLIVRLRFYEGMTAKQIAAVLPSLEPMEIYRRIDKICNKLAKSARALGVDAVLLASEGDEIADSGLPDALDATEPIDGSLDDEHSPGGGNDGPGRASSGRAPPAPGVARARPSQA
jgi:RNA polymerase sigma factor (sigma-70 family)